MINEIRERLSWDVDCTVLLVRSILAIAVVVGIVWYQVGSYRGGSEGLNNWSVMVANSEPRPATIWEIAATLVMFALSLVLFFAVLQLPFLAFVLPWLMSWGVMSARCSRDNQVERDNENTCNEKSAAENQRTYR